MTQSKYIKLIAHCIGFVLFFVSLFVAMGSSESRAIDPVDPFKLSSISSGKHHSCGVAADGTVWCWGLGTSGQMGDLSYSDNTTPNKVYGIDSGVVAVTAGGAHSCAVGITGLVGCWGSNVFGQLGNTTSQNPTTFFRPVVQEVPGISASAISAGQNHTCALLTNSSVSCWGSNVYGQLGIGSKINSTSPVLVPGLQGVIAIAAGEDNSCALLSDRTVKCWGGNLGNQLGATESTTPITLQGFTGVTQLALGFWQTCAVLTNKTVKCVGMSLDYSTQSATPYLVAGMSNVSHLAHFGGHMCAVIEDRSVRCVGENQRKQLGDRTSITRTTAVTVASIDDAVAVSVGWWHSCALLTTGLVKCWGSGTYGQSGQGDIAKYSRNSAVPKYVKRLHTLSFGDVADSAVGDSPVTLSASLTSGVGVDFRSRTPEVCEVSGNVVITKSAGMCTIIASADDRAADFFTGAASITKEFTVRQWSGSRGNSVTTFNLKTSDGTPVTGVRLTWTTLGAENPASGSATVTNSSGTVTMSTISGPAVIRVSSLYHDGLNSQFDKRSVSQYLFSYSTVEVLGNGEKLLNLGTRPVPSERNFTVRLSDGTPVRGAQVFLAVTTNAWLEPSRTVSGSHLNGFAKWNTSNQIDRAEPCFNDGNSLYDNSATNVKGNTDENGNISLKVYSSTGVENLISACYNDSEFTQKRTVAIASSGTTSITLGYMAKVNVSVSRMSISSGGSESVSAQVVDANGNPVSSQSVQVMAGSVDSTATALTCSGSRGTTNANGFVTVNICPSASGNYFLKSNGTLSSRLIYVTVGASESSGGGGGGGGGDDDEPAAPKATAPKLTPSTSTLAPRNSVPPTNTKAPVIPATAGTVVPNLVQPKAAVAQGLAIAAASNKVTIALKSPVAITSTAKISSYVVTVRSSTGAIVKRVTVAVKTAGQTVSSAIAIAKSGDYVIEISGKNSKGKVLGTYKSSAIKVGK
jgi:alpha-tubulin suppressor-like RCC1 family protein